MLTLSSPIIVHTKFINDNRLFVSFFYYRLAGSVPNVTIRNPPSCSFASFLIVSLTPSNNNLESLRE